LETLKVNSAWKEDTALDSESLVTLLKGCPLLHDLRLTVLNDVSALSALAALMQHRGAIEKLEFENNRSVIPAIYT
jgi:hypothetical protein